MFFIVAELGESEEKTWAGSQGIKARKLALPLSGCYLGQRSTLAGSLLLIYLINGEPLSCFVSYSVSWTTRWLAHSSQCSFFCLEGARLSMANGQEAEKQGL